MTSTEQMETEGGNTITPSVRPIQGKNWCFTLNNFTMEQKEQMVLKFETLASRYYFAEEIGESGTPHFQGTVEFKRKLRPVTAIGIPSIHWERRKGSWDEAVNYCMKEDGEKYYGGFKPRRPLKALPCEVLLFPWQQSMFDIVSAEPDDRTIVWVWETAGAVGKTTFLKWLMRFHEAIPLEGKKADILNIALNHESEIYVYDLERSMEQFVSYASIEKIKNGCFMSGKYEGGMVNRNCPHLVVFANFPPEKEKLSLDRWKIYKIENLELVEHVELAPLFN